MNFAQAQNSNKNENEKHLQNNVENNHFDDLKQNQKDYILPEVQIRSSFNQKENQKNKAASSISGFMDAKEKELPASIIILDQNTIKQTAAKRLADLTQSDASITDSYNSVGYFDSLTVRGFTLDANYNYRREGLPISAQTIIPLDNKERIEILKGSSGIQAGTSAPAGLVNYVVKRPLASSFKHVQMGLGESGSRLLSLDLNQRDNQSFAWRLNIAHETLRPLTQNTKGERALLALATDFKFNPDTLLKAEIESSWHQQSSLAAQSLLGSYLPFVENPNINLNNQAWSKPNEFNSLTGTIQLNQVLSDDWNLKLNYGQQYLRNNDRLAYPFGCTDLVNSIYYADRYCPNNNINNNIKNNPNIGSADFYAFQSDHEKRRIQAFQSEMQGHFDLFNAEHFVNMGLLRSILKHRFQPQADFTQLIGQGFTDGSSILDLPESLLNLNYPNINRSEQSTELSIQNESRWNNRFSTWLGLRHSWLNRQSEKTDQTEYTHYQQTITTPWLGIRYALNPELSLYSSWGQGAESFIVPNRANYINAGLALPTLISTQKEIGLKGRLFLNRFDDSNDSNDSTHQHHLNQNNHIKNQDLIDWQLTYFHIKRPAITDIPIDTELCLNKANNENNNANNNANNGILSSCFNQNVDGQAKHQGIEAALEYQNYLWKINSSASFIHAVRSSFDPNLDRRKPNNVPRFVFRVNALRDLKDWTNQTGWFLGGALSHEAKRAVIDRADEQISLPSWTRLDSLLRFENKNQSWQMNIENINNRRYWRESPLLLGHVYLYAGSARTFRLNWQVRFD